MVIKISRCIENRDSVLLLKDFAEKFNKLDLKDSEKAVLHPYLISKNSNLGFFITFFFFKFIEFNM